MHQHFSAPPQAAPEQRVLQVLIVDDDPRIMSLVRLTLLDEGHRVRTAHDGVEGMAEVEAEPPDAIVLDLEMPVMDGRAFFRALRSAGNDSPVLVLSAYGAHQARRELGAEAALDKPFEPQELLRVLNRIARR